MGDKYISYNIVTQVLFTSILETKWTNVSKSVICVYVATRSEHGTWKHNIYTCCIRS